MRGRQKGKENQMPKTKTELKQNKQQGYNPLFLSIFFSFFFLP